MRTLILSMVILIFSSCYYDSETDLYGTSECDTNEVTYGNDVLKIIDDNCYNCHNVASNFGGITLEGYDQFKSYVDSGVLLGVIKHESGFSPMPKNTPQLLDCEIQKIEAWIIDGAQNN